MGNLIWSSSSHLNLKMLRFTLLLLLQLGVAHFQNCPLSKTFLQCDKGTGGRRFFGSDPTHWDPDTVIDAGMDQHYDCRACCRDKSVCSIPQCDTGLTSPGCHMDQGPEIVDEDLPSPQVPRDWQDQGSALPRPSNIPVEQEIVDEDQLSRQVSRERLTDRPRRPSHKNNFAQKRWIRRETKVEGQTQLLCVLIFNSV